MLSWDISSVTTFTRGFFFLIMLYLKMVLASSSVSISLLFSIPFFWSLLTLFSLFNLFTFGVRMTTYLALSILTLSYELSFKGDPFTKYISEKYLSCDHYFPVSSSSCRITIGDGSFKWSALKGITKCLIFSTIPQITIWFSASFESYRVLNSMSYFKTSFDALWHIFNQSL